MKYCTNCGESIDDKAVICPKCGVAQPSAIGTEKNKLVAALLAIFLGGFGIHKFYLNRPVQGIIYLLLCWTFIPALAGFIEGIIYLCTSDQNFALKYATKF